MRKFILWFFTIVLSLLLISNVSCMIIAEMNFKHNVKEWEKMGNNGIIYYQNDYPNIKFGLGNVANNGCGAIAVYNILYLEGKYKPFPEIVKFFDDGNENIFGLLGSNPFSVMSFMKNEGYKVKTYLKSSDFKTAAINSKYSILMYLNLQYGHYQLLYNYDNQLDLFYENPRVRIDLDTLLESKKGFFKILITIN